MRGQGSPHGGDGKADGEVNELLYKHCPTCGLTKQISEFSRYKRSKDGFYWECKSCKKLRDKRDYETHKEERLKRSKEWKSQNTEKVKQIRERYKPTRREQERERREANRKQRIEELGLRPWTPIVKESPEDE